MRANIRKVLLEFERRLDNKAGSSFPNFRTVNEIFFELRINGLMIEILKIFD